MIFSLAEPECNISTPRQQIVFLGMRLPKNGRFTDRFAEPLSKRRLAHQS
jgi:hypothetical protein